MVNYIPSVLQTDFIPSIFFPGFFHEGCWILSEACSASIEMIMWFFALYYVYMMYYLYVFAYIEPTLHQRKQLDYDVWSFWDVVEFTLQIFVWDSFFHVFSWLHLSSSSVCRIPLVSSAVLFSDCFNFCLSWIFKFLLQIWLIDTVLATVIQVDICFPSAVKMHHSMLFLPLKVYVENSAIFILMDLPL
jgi:hypothetical protein